MKRLLGVVMILVIACSVTPEQKAKNAINEELRLTLNDFKNYEPVSYGILKFSITDIFDNQEFQKYIFAAKRCMEAYEKYNRMAGYTYEKGNGLFNRKASAAFDSANIYRNIFIKMKESFIPDTIGWEMNHSFRTKNAFGGYKLTEYTFILDRNLTKVIKIKEISENIK